MHATPGTDTKSGKGGGGGGGGLSVLGPILWEVIAAKIDAPYSMIGGGGGGGGL